MYTHVYIFKSLSWIFFPDVQKSGGFRGRSADVVHKPCCTCPQILVFAKQWTWKVGGTTVSAS